MTEAHSPLACLQDYIVAVNAAQMNSGWCGKTVHITNTATGASITATIADT